MKLGPRSELRSKAFTILEIMIAIFIFSLILTAIYSIWWAILKGSILGLETAASVQRSRVAVRALEDAFLTSAMYKGNIKYYYFLADTAGEMAEVSMASRLPDSFPGVGRYGDQVVRRVSFKVERTPNGNVLRMAQVPILQDVDQNPPYTLTLAKDVTLFKLSFYDLMQGQWLDEWTDTNQMPRMVKIQLGMGKMPNSNEPQDSVTRLISIPAAAASGHLQGAGPPMPQPPPITPAQ